ncbi:MAG: MBL fold metallo-hydrolase [Treponema sp.]|jgi:beta-lactamase superfamily II metal-dependent hydrolase|nr:MBL fold metallo-hydrolase [Treponema sp.]
MQDRAETEVGSVYVGWKEGEMDIHHIYTGRGESSFLIFPDGTSMLIDAGDFDPPTPDPFNFEDMKMCDPLPDPSRRAGEWIARYIRKVNPAKSEVNYLVVSHFHSDHVGDAHNNARRTEGRDPDYVLTGIAEAGEYLRIHTAVDRGWPLYNYPKPLEDVDFCVENYRSFLAWKMKSEGLRPEAVDIGGGDQFVLRKNPLKYSGLFEVRTLAASGKIWTGRGKETVNYFDLNPRNISDDLNENKNSIGMRISYGPFRYYTAGDFSETLLDGKGYPVNIEGEIAKICGPAHVCKANHHSYLDTMTEEFISNIRAQAYIIPVWDYLHIQPSTMTNMASRRLYPGERMIFPTAFPDVIKEAYKDEPWMTSVCKDYGHVVVKVFDQGRQFKIYILSAGDESGTVKAVFSYFSKELSLS